MLGNSNPPLASSHSYETLSTSRYDKNDGLPIEHGSDRYVTRGYNHLLSGSFSGMPVVFGCFLRQDFHCRDQVFHLRQLVDARPRIWLYHRLAVLFVAKNEDQGLTKAFRSPKTGPNFLSKGHGHAEDAFHCCHGGMGR
jgi:hypothetical protein